MFPSTTAYASLPPKSGEYPSGLLTSTPCTLPTLTTQLAVGSQLSVAPAVRYPSQVGRVSHSQIPSMQGPRPLHDTLLHVDVSLPHTQQLWSGLRNFSFTVHSAPSTIPPSSHQPIFAYAWHPRGYFGAWPLNQSVSSLQLG